MTNMTDYLQYGLMASHVYADYLQPGTVVQRSDQNANDPNGISAFNVNAGLGPGWDIATVDMPLFMLPTGQSSFDKRIEGPDTPDYYSGGAVDSVYWQQRAWDDQAKKTSAADNPYATDKESAQMNGFYARVYVNAETHKAVIAIEGSESLDYAIPAKNALKDIPGANIKDSTLDWLGNDLPAIAGDQVLPQMFPAYHFSQWAIENLHAAGITDITFTGHSLGGGLAAAMFLEQEAYAYANH